METILFLRRGVVCFHFGFCTPLDGVVGIFVWGSGVEDVGNPSAAQIIYGRNAVHREEELIRLYEYRKLESW
jgi:hypothetical protein